MAKKRQPTTADDQPLTPLSKSNQPPPSKEPEEDKVEEIDDDEVISVNTSSSEGEEDDDDDAESKEDEDNNEEETDTDFDDETVSPPKLKSINAKSNDETLKSKSKPKSSATTAKSGTKRSADDDTKQSKKKKIIAAVDDEKEKEVDNKMSGDVSKKLFQRVFTEDDELAILKGLVDFKKVKGTDPLKYPTLFYEEVKHLISFPVTLDQLKDKMRRLKSKFENKMKICKNGKTPTFSKPIEEEMFDFSKKIWGGTDENGKPNEKQVAAKKPPTTKKESDFQVGSISDGNQSHGTSFIVSEMQRFDKSVSGLFGLGLLKSEWESIEESKRAELEIRWKQLQVAELKCVAMRAELTDDSAKLILEALRSSSSDD